MPRGGTKNRRQKNLFPAVPTYQRYSCWKQQDEALPANNPAPNTRYTSLDAPEGKDAITSMQDCWIPSLKDEEKSFSESHGLVGKGDNLAISRNESSSEKFVMSLFLTPLVRAGLHAPIQIKQILFHFKLPC